MKVRHWMVAGAALAVALAGAAVLTLERASGDGRSLHGDFEHRFQPRLEGGLVFPSGDRAAAIGSVKDLRPVNLVKR